MRISEIHDNDDGTMNDVDDDDNINNSTYNAD